ALVTAFPVLVIYMGTRNLSMIATSLTHAGMKETTAVTILHAVSLAGEAQEYGTLSDVVAGRLQAISPSIVVIGDVVNERREWRHMR
ncbi:MAG: uroporphyrin-III methyltransferase, partial [Mariprofundus sp.]